MAGRVGLEDSDMRDDQIGGPLYERSESDSEPYTGKGAPLVPEVDSYDKGIKIENTKYDTPENMAEDLGKPLSAVKAALEGDEKAIDFIWKDDVSPEASQVSRFTYTRDGVLR